MQTQASPAMKGAPSDAAGRRDAKIIAAARVISIDYRSIVDNAVCGLADNTPDARRDVYAQARKIVERHLQLMRLPEPIVELEKLSLDLTVRKIERQWRARQRDAIAARREKSKVPSATVTESFAAFARAFAALGRALASLAIVLGLRPFVSAAAIVPSALRAVLRGLFSPVGLAAALPIVAMAIFITFFVDNNIAYRSLADGPAGRWLARLDLLPSDPAPGVRSKSQERIEARSVPSRTADAAPQPAATTVAPPRNTAADATSRGPTRVRPVRADFSGAPAPMAAFAAPPPPQPRIASACDGIQSTYERTACVTSQGNRTELDPPGSTRDSLPGWLSGYAEINHVNSIRFAATPAAPSDGAAPVDQTSVAVALPEATISGAEESVAATPPVVAAPDNAPRTEPPTVEHAVAPMARPANSKVAALIEGGKRAAVKGDLERAVQNFSEAIRIDPKFPDSYSERGQALFKMGETERAIADYSAAIQRNPQHGAALRARGMAYLYRGTADLALADLSRAIELAENDPSRLAPIDLFYARRSRAAIYSAKLQYEQEIADCSALIDSYARDPMLAAALKESYRDIGAANIMAAVYRQRAAAHIRRSSWELAIADLSAAIPLSVDRGYSALIDRSKLNESLGRRDQAIGDLQSALAVRPTSEEARSALKRLGAAPKPTPVRAI
jgi:tetratricopeptide (TPR) repeat protein